MHLSDGREILSLYGKNRYYTVQLDVGENISVKSFVPHEPQPYEVQDSAYDDFVTRLAIWKSSYIEEESKPITDLGTRSISLTTETMGDLMRDRLKTEIAILPSDAVAQTSLGGKIFSYDLMLDFNDDYLLFTYRLTGDEINSIYQSPPLTAYGTLQIVGFNGTSISGQPVSGGRMYTVSSSHLVYRRVREMLNREISVVNTWSSSYDVVAADLAKTRVLAHDNFNYLEDRWGMIIALNLANTVQFVTVSQGNNITAPTGMPTYSYTQWGLEDTVDFTFYNARHTIEFTPYINYVREDVPDQNNNIQRNYLENILRGTLLYKYHTSDTIQPYEKTVCETAVSEVNGLRPTLLRETAGSELTYQFIKFNLGAGFEKMIYDYPLRPVYGIETITDIHYTFFNKLTPAFTWDEFWGRDFEYNRFQIRSDFSLSLTLKLNDYLNLVAKREYYYLYSAQVGQLYIDTQTTLSINLITEFKYF
jgi:hypothetical protein